LAKFGLIKQMVLSNLKSLLENGSIVLQKHYPRRVPALGESIWSMNLGTPG